MPKEYIRRSLALVMVPMLIATAAIAQPPQDTPEEKPAEQSGDAEDPVVARWNRDKARSEAAKAAFEERKARNDAQASAAASTFGPLSTHTGATGEITVAEANRGELEATLLSAIAMQEAVDPLAAQVAALARRFNGDGDRQLAYACPGTTGTGTGYSCDPPQPPQFDIRSGAAGELCQGVSRLGAVPQRPRHRPIIVVSEDAQGPAALAETFDVQTASLARELCRALAESDQLSRQEARENSLVNLGRERAGGSIFPAAGAVVDVLGNLLRTDYSIYGINLTAEQNQLVREMAGALLATGLPNPIYTPGLFPVGSTTDDNPALQRIALLDRLSAEAANAAARHTAVSRLLEQQSANLSGAAVLALGATKEDHDRVKARLSAAASEYGKLITSLTTAADGASPPLAGIIRQANTAALLRQGGLLVVTKIHFQGGTAFSRQNFFSSMFGMPYRVSGGVLISSIVQDGTTGRVYQTEVVPVSGGFHGPTQLRRVIEEARSQRRERRRARSD